MGGLPTYASEYSWSLVEKGKPMSRLDPLFQTKHKFVVIGKANKELGEVYVLSEKYIVSSKRAQRGPIRCVKVVS
ncbi:hypothetical protein D3C86_2188690 [compost metagenome]